MNRELGVWIYEDCALVSPLASLPPMSHRFLEPLGPFD